MRNTEMKYVKNKIEKLEEEFAGFASLLIQAGIVEVVDSDEGPVFKIHKVKLDD